MTKANTLNIPAVFRKTAFENTRNDRNEARDNTWNDRTEARDNRNEKENSNNLTASESQELSSKVLAASKSQELDSRVLAASESREQTRPLKNPSKTVYTGPGRKKAGRFENGYEAKLEYASHYLEKLGATFMP